MKSLMVFCILIVNSLLFPQDNSSVPSGNLKSVKIYFLNGYGVIYQISKPYPLRFHVDISTQGFSADTDYEYFKFGTDTLNIDQTIGSNEEAFSFSLSPQYYITPVSKGYFTFYGGTGPFFSYGGSSGTSKIVSSGSLSSEYDFYRTNSAKKYDLGILFFTGIEGRINSNLGIFSEVDLRVGRSWIDNTLRSEQRFKNGTSVNYNSETFESRWFFNLSSIRLGVFIEI